MVFHGHFDKQTCTATLVVGAYKSKFFCLPHNHVILKDVAKEEEKGNTKSVNLALLFKHIHHSHDTFSLCL